MQIRAIRELDCIDRAKFRYLLPMPASDTFLDRFADAVVTMRRFSQFSPLSRDLFVIRKAGAFLAEGVVGGREISVLFYAEPDPLPADLMEAFAETLKGIGDIVYVQAPHLECRFCSQGASKQCRRSIVS